MHNRNLTSRFAQRAAVALGAAALPALSFAQGLPQLENPTRGTGNGIMETIRNYGYDIIMLVALLVVASMFIGVCYHAYGTYAEIHTGRKTWGQFGLTVAIGAVLTMHPRLLVLDEPTSALDPTAAEEVLATLTRLVHDLGLGCSGDRA